MMSDGVSIMNGTLKFDDLKVAINYGNVEKL